jgi:hypothetical protein
MLTPAVAFFEERSMTPQKGWPVEAEQQRKRALRLAQQSMMCIDLAQRSIEQQAVKDALLYAARLQNSVRQIELQMEQAQTGAIRWGKHVREVRALVRELAQTISREATVLKRDLIERSFEEALIELAELQGNVIDIQVLLVSVAIIVR